MFVIGVENRLAFWIIGVVGTVIALLLGYDRMQKANVHPRKMLLATILLPFCTLFFAHLMYGIVDMENLLYDHSILYLLAFWENGVMLYGGMLGVIVALFFIGGKKDFLQMVECYAPSGAWMIAVSRIAEGALGQGYGEYFWEDSFFARFPFSVYDPYCDAWAWALFLLEALVALVLFYYLLRKKPTFAGDGALLLIGLYACAQVVLESLRRDEFLRWGFVRVSEVVSVVVVLIVLICYCLRADKGHKRSKFLCFGLYVTMVVFCLLLEFATESRIPFLTFLSVSQCYQSMAIASVLMGISVLWMRWLGIKRFKVEKMESCV